MTVKLIAVDMDGTFLDSRMRFDKRRFFEQYQKMKEQGIRFVVASGNQYYQLKSFFGEIQDELSYVAENGALVMEQGEEVFSVAVPEKDIRLILEELVLHEQLSVVLCGRKSAYVLNSVSNQFYERINKYYHRLQRVATFSEVEDRILKFALAVPEEETDEMRTLLHARIGAYITPVSSGHGSVDLIVPGFHKAHGIQLLQERWDIADEETMAFGDSPNDIEMLRHVQYSFAMANAREEVKQVARFHAPHHNQSGVLEIIDQCLRKEGPFSE